MSTLATAALAAYEAQRQAKEAAEAARRAEMLASARAELATVLTDPAVKVDTSKVPVVHEDYQTPLFVFSDGTPLAVRRSGDAWQVNLVREDGPGRWVDLGGPIASLAQLGERLAQAEG